jgi:hypothetical protein
VIITISFSLGIDHGVLIVIITISFSLGIDHGVLIVGFGIKEYPLFHK